MQKVTVYRQRGFRVALVVHLADLALLGRCVGVIETAAMLAGLATRIGTALGVEPPAPSGPRAEMAVFADVDGPASMRRLAARLRPALRSGLHLPPGAPLPRLGAVLVRGRDAGDDPQLLAAARRHLHSFDDADLPLLDARTLDTDGPGLFDPAWVVAHFQPQLCCHTGTVSGFELLARLNHPTRGLLDPSQFLPGLSPDQLRQLSRTMLVRGLEALAHWAAAGFLVDTVSLNVSAVDLIDPQFADFVLWELDRQSVPPQRLVLEVIEELSPVDMADAVQRNLARLAHLGCGVDLDDFGKGYASLEALHRLPVQRVKIDRSFVIGCDSDPGQQRMVLAILALAERMGIATLAEGVETPAQHAFAAQIGCSHVQGYAIARPMPLDATLGFLADRRAASVQTSALLRRA